MNKILLIAVSSLMLFSCGNSKLETPANLSIKYFDAYDNPVYDAYLSFYKGKKTLGDYFEFVSEDSAKQECAKRMKKITEDKNYFRTSYSAANMFWGEQSPLEYKEFDRIKKLQFECHVKSEEVNDDCFADKFVEISKKELGGNLKSLENFTDEQKDEFTKNVLSQLQFWEMTGTCNYKVLNKSKIYNLNELM